MKARQLIEELEWAIESNGGDDVEVRSAQQPKWAFEYSIREAVTVNLNQNPKEDNEWIVYLEEGGQIGYLPSEASEELGW
tara:strand:+ start:73 stop:312 length:240 start_codon:yes stop_codon:yes gene_type:complete